MPTRRHPSSASSTALPLALPSGTQPLRRALRPARVVPLLLAMAFAGGATCLPTSPEADAGTGEPEPIVDPESAEDAGPPPAPDEEGPVVTFLAPEDRCLSGVVTFRFSVVDTGVGAGFVSAEFAGAAMDVVEGEAGEYSGSVATDGLLLGLKELIVTAIDRRNNSTTANRVFAVSDGETFIEHQEFTCGTPPDPPPDDTEPPTVEVISPLSTFDVFESATFDLTVRATDDVGPVTVVASAGANTVTLAPGGNDQFTGVLSLAGLPEGPIVVTVTATDLAARTAQTTRTITIDRTPPTVTITEPSEGAEREWLNDVIALADDANGVERVTLFEQGVTTPLGSATAPLPGTSDEFGIIHELSCDGLPRDLTFVVEARDRAGNVGADTVGVTIRFNAQCN